MKSFTLVEDVAVVVPLDVRKSGGYVGWIFAILSVAVGTDMDGLGCLRLIMTLLPS